MLFDSLYLAEGITLAYNSGAAMLSRETIGALRYECSFNMESVTRVDSPNNAHSCSSVAMDLQPICHPCLVLVATLAPP